MHGKQRDYRCDICEKSFGFSIDIKKQCIKNREIANSQFETITHTGKRRSFEFDEFDMNFKDGKITQSATVRYFPESVSGRP